MAPTSWACPMCWGRISRGGLRGPRCTGSLRRGGGFQWFPIPRLPDGSTEAMAEAGIEASAADLNAFLDAAWQRKGLRPTGWCWSASVRAR